MKKIISMLLLVFLLVGCSSAPEVKGAGGRTELEIKTLVFNAVEKYEVHARPVIKETTWEEEAEVVDGIKDDLYVINSKYEHQGKIYKVRILIHNLPNDEFKLIRYHNITNGNMK